MSFLMLTFPLQSSQYLRQNFPVIWKYCSYLLFSLIFRAIKNRFISLIMQNFHHIYILQYTQVSEHYFVLMVICRSPKMVTTIESYQHSIHPWLWSIVSWEKKNHMYWDLDLMGITVLPILLRQPSGGREVAL